MKRMLQFKKTELGYACFENDSEIVAQVAKIFPVFFAPAYSS